MVAAKIFPDPDTMAAVLFALIRKHGYRRHIDDKIWSGGEWPLDQAFKALGLSDPCLPADLDDQEKRMLQFDDQEKRMLQFPLEPPRDREADQTEAEAAAPSAEPKESED